MRLTRFEIQKLFYKFDITIPFNNDDRITIIHGPNGSGKTTILQLINDFFMLKFSRISKVPFGKMSFFFDSSLSIHIYKNGFYASILDSENNSKNLKNFKKIFNDERLIFNIENFEKISDEVFFRLSRTGYEHINLGQNNIEKDPNQKSDDGFSINTYEDLEELKLKINDTIFLQDLDARTAKYYENFQPIRRSLSDFTEEDLKNDLTSDLKNEIASKMKTFEKLRIERNLIAHGRMDRMSQQNREALMNEYNQIEQEILILQKQIKSEATSPMPRDPIDRAIGILLVRISRQIRPRLIQSNRLKTQSIVKQKQGDISTINLCADDLKQMMSDVNDKYNDISQKTEQTFVNQLMKAILSGKEPISNSIKEDLKNLRATQEHLTDFGLYKFETDITSQYSIDNISNQPEAKIALDLYIKDTQQKISVYIELDNQMVKFQKIISDLFWNKKICFSRERGFWFIDTATNIEISPEQLSSGEQNIVIMLFRLLFQIPSNSLVLIDEPEISLNTGWQRKFIGILGDIVKINQIDIVVSTHAPAIIADRRDLLVRIGKVEKNEL